jgi:hypothetical protein
MFHSDEGKYSGLNASASVPLSLEVMKHKSDMREECDSKAARQSILERAPQRGLVFVAWDVERHTLHTAQKVSVSHEASVHLYQRDTTSLCHELARSQTIASEFRTSLLRDKEHRYHCGVSMAVAELRAALVTKLQHTPFPLSMSGADRVRSLLQTATPFVGVSILLFKQNTCIGAHSWSYTE